MDGNQFVISPPRGPIAQKYMDVIQRWDFAEEGICGPQGTAKSNMLVDLIMYFGSYVPGAHILYARSTLTALKGSALQLFQDRYGSIFDGTRDSGSRNLNEGRFYFPEAIHPVTGKRVRSTLRALGLDREDIKQHQKSTEYSLIVFEEADELSMDIWDFLLGRNRQKVFHSELTVEHMCRKLSRVWGGIPYREVHEILLDDPRHRVGQDQLGLDHPMPVMPILKAAWNPSGDNAIWNRFCKSPYPVKSHPTPDWVRKHVGVFEKHIDPDFIGEFRETGGAGFLAGEIVRINDDTHPRGYVRRFAAGEDRERGVLRLVRDPSDPDAPLEVPLSEAWMIKQRNFIYVFPGENHSRNYENDANMFLMENQDTQRSVLLGLDSQRDGRVFPRFVKAYRDRGGHLLRWTARSKRSLERAGLRFFGGIDQGGAHATAVVGMVHFPKYDLLVVYDEHVVTGETASETAATIVSMPLAGCPEAVFGYDPAMEARNYTTRNEMRSIDYYVDQLGSSALIAADRGVDAFHAVNDRLAFSGGDAFGGYGGPRLLVYDHCVNTIQALSELTWRMVSSQRDRREVDVGDALKYGVSAKLKRDSFSSAGLLSDDDVIARLVAPKGFTV